MTRTVVNLLLLAGLWALITQNPTYQNAPHTHGLQVKAAVFAVAVVAVLNVAQITLKRRKAAKQQPARRSASDFRIVPAGRRGRR